jgi:ATP-binding cassette subfamily B protein
MRYYGRKVSMKYLRDLCLSNKEGVSIYDIGKAAEVTGLRTLALWVKYDDLRKKIPLPCIVHWEMNHFIVVYKITSEKVYVSDPAAGLLTYSREEFCNNWAAKEGKGGVVVVEPGVNFHDFEDLETPTVFGHFTKYLKPYKRFIIQVFVGMIMGIALSLIFPMITQALVDTGIDNHNINFVYLLLTASLVLTFSSTIAGYIQSRIMLYVSDKMNMNMISDFIAKLMKLPVSFFERKMMSDILLRISDHGRIQSFLMHTFLGLVIAGLSLVVYSVIMMFYSVSLFAIFITGNIIFCLWIVLFLKRRRKLDYRYFKNASDNQNDLIEILESIPEIKVNNIAQQKRWKWLSSRIDIYNLNFKVLNLGQTQGIGSTIISKITGLLVTFYSAKSVIDGEMTLGMMMSAQYILGQLSGPIGSFLGYIQSWQDAKISLERINEIIYEEKEEVDYVGIPNPVPENADINLRNVSFRYHQNLPFVLKNLNITLPAGKITAIAGESGSGKTTLMKLLLKLYEPVEGEILIDKTDLATIDSETWRSRCGAVLQDGKIFNDTILYNITLADEDIDMKQLNYAVEAANIGEYINKLPQKLYTVLGTNGIGLSEGQKQRLLIARTFYKNPDIILLDEATNSLDAKNETEISNRLNELVQGRTAMVIAHRLSTIKTAHLILVLRNGEIAEQGNHQSLIEKRGIYYDLVKNQLFD